MVDTILGLPVISNVVGFLQTYWAPLTSFIGSFALLATITANKTDDKIMNYVLKAINFLGANIGKAKNDPNES